MEATPFRMTPDVIREVVEKHRPGVYVLGHIVDGRFVFQYVGRSDYCVQTRLLTHEYLYDCSYFILALIHISGRDAMNKDIEAVEQFEKILNCER